VTDPDFLDVEEVIALHDRQLEAVGGSPGIRDRGLLESAVAQPMATFGGTFVLPRRGPCRRTLRRDDRRR